MQGDFCVGWLQNRNNLLPSTVFYGEFIIIVHMKLNYLYGFVILLISGCAFTQKIKTGEQAYEVKQYAIATQMLTEEYKQTSYLNEKAKKAFLIGSSYERMNHVEKAAEWYKLSDDHNYGTIALEKYAAMLKRSQKYPQAIQVYQQLSNENNNALKYRQQVTACQLADEWWSEKDNSNYRTEQMPFNSSASEYAPYVMGPDMVAFSSDRPQSTGDDIYTWTGNHFSDLFVAYIGSNVVESFDPTINSKENEGTIILNRDQSEMYFTRCYSEETYDGYCKIMVSYRRGSGWSNPEPLSFQQDGINYGHPVISDSDSILFFSCNDPAGTGGYDLYYLTRSQTGWEKPTLLSNRINTEGDEKFPTLHHDTLYFASNYHLGMGGLDIFKTYPLSDGNWAPPENLKPPINTGWDDFSFVVDTFARLRGTELQKGYFSSSRNTGSGNDDIFAYTKLGVQPGDEDVTEVIAEKPTKPKQYRIYVALKVVEPVLEDPDDPNSKRIGRNPLPGAKVAGNDGPMATLFRTDQQGYLILELEYGKDYSFRSTYPDHFANTIDFSTKEIEKDPDEPTKTINKELVLDPIIRNREIVLDNIYYDLDKWNIRDDAKPVLDSLALILKQNPGLNIELGAHTDCRESDAYNMTLSQRRAQSAMLYLSRKGIASKRLSSVGYGESKPAISCVCENCTEEQHQGNRRTTFKILE